MGVPLLRRGPCVDTRTTADRWFLAPDGADQTSVPDVRWFGHRATRGACGVDPAGPCSHDATPAASNGVGSAGRCSCVRHTSNGEWRRFCWKSHGRHPSSVEWRRFRWLLFHVRHKGSVVLRSMLHRVSGPSAAGVCPVSLLVSPLDVNTPLAHRNGRGVGGEGILRASGAKGEGPTRIGPA
jgi:hypothetical protein